MGGCKLSNSNSDHRGKNANDATSGAEIGAATGTAVAAAGAAANADATASIAASAGISASLAQTYTNLIWDLRLLQWSNYFEGGVHDLSLLDSQFFMLAKQFLSRYASAFIPTDRQSEIVRTLLSRDLVDKNPAAPNCAIVLMIGIIIATMIAPAPPAPPPIAALPWRAKCGRMFLT